MILLNEIIKLCDTIITQNYFQFENSQYLQEQRLDMVAPTSSIFSEIYLQFIENTKIFSILKNYQINGYFRYVDDILIVYKNRMTNIHEILELIGSIF